MLKLLSLAAIAGLAASQSTKGFMETLSGNSQASSFAKLISGFSALAAQLESSTNITVLAPTNTAIDAMMSTLSGNSALAQAVINYHVLNGSIFNAGFPTTPTFIATHLNTPAFSNVTGGQRVESQRTGNNVTFTSYLKMNSSVVQSDIAFTGGVIHVIDTVLNVPQNDSAWDIVANFTSLNNEFIAAGILPNLDGLPDLTIFAPPNTAFTEVNSSLSALSMTELASVLNFHVVNGSVLYSTMLSNNMKLGTLNGDTITIRKQSGGVFVNNALLMVPDIFASNGVFHVIDNVLNPNDTAAPAASATAGTNAFAANATSSAGASGAAGASSTSSGFAVPMKTGAVGAAALFGAGAAFMNL